MPLSSAALKNALRELVPLKYQVSVKFHYNRFAAMLEPEMKLLRGLVQKNERVIDVGGNRGTYAYQLWKLGAKVEIFEPNVTCSRVLSAWAEGKSDVNIHSVGLSNCVGRTQLYVPVDESGVEHDASGSVEARGFLSGRAREVQLRTLDSYGFEDVTFIKIDVEGHEFSVIEGAATTLRRTKPALLIEIEQRHIDRPIAEVFEKISAFGYEGYFLDEGKLIGLGRFDPARDQSPSAMEQRGKRYINNFIFLHRDKLAVNAYAKLTELAQ